jgi:hypothetical protein
MTRCFIGNRVSSFIGVNGMFGYVINILFIERNHFGRKKKNRDSVYSLMRPKTPGVGLMLEADE